MKAFLVYAAIIIAIIVVGLGLDWLFEGQNFFMYKYWAPKYEDVRRNTYTHTLSYRQGSVQRLNTLCTQVAAADDGHKPMLNDVIAHEFAEWNTDEVPSYLHSCLATARAN